MQGKLPLEQEDSTASLPDAEQTKGTLSYTTPDSVAIVRMHVGHKPGAQLSGYHTRL